MLVCFREILEVECRYAAALDRQTREIERLSKSDELPIPADIDYHKLGSLSAEEKEVCSLTFQLYCSPTNCGGCVLETERNTPDDSEPSGTNSWCNTGCNASSVFALFETQT